MLQMSKLITEQQHLITELKNHTQEIEDVYKGSYFKMQSLFAGTWNMVK